MLGEMGPVTYRIRVDPDELRLSAREIEEAGQAYLALADRSLTVGLHAPSYDGQFGPRVRAISTEGSARLRALSGRLAEQAQELRRIADDFDGVDRASQRSMAAWGQQLLGFHQAGLRFLPELDLPWETAGRDLDDSCPPDWARWIPGLWFLWWLYCQMRGVDGSPVAALPTLVPTVMPEATATQGPTVPPNVIPTATPGPRSYSVQPGDTLWNIGSQYGLSVPQLMGANGLTGDLIIPGQVLVIPDPSFQVPAGGGATVPLSANEYGAVPALDFAAVQYQRGFSDQHDGIDVSGLGDITVNSSFEGRIVFYWDGDFGNVNPDLDLAAAANTRDDASLNFGWGNSMVVEYPYGDQPESAQATWAELYDVGPHESVYLQYGHLRTGFDEDGFIASDYEVHPGDMLANMGNTGISTGQHLHLGVKVGPSGAVGARESPEGSGQWVITGQWYDMGYQDPAGLGLVPSDSGSP